MSGVSVLLLYKLCWSGWMEDASKEDTAARSNFGSAPAVSSLLSPRTDTIHHLSVCRTKPEWKSMIVRQTLPNMSNFETSKLTCTNLPQQSLPLDARDEDFKLVMVSNVSVHSGRKVGVRKSQTSSSWSGRMATRDEITWATTNSSNLLLLLSYVTCSVLLDAEEPATKTGAYESLGDHV